MDASLLPSVVAALQKTIDVQEPDSYEHLKRELTAQLVYMLHHEMDKLMGILYRIDVRERDVKAAFAQNNPKLIAPLLAEAIIQRELEKARSRRDHSAK